jgi:serine/threonine-protein kinase
MDRPVSRSAQPFGRYELLERIRAGGMAEVFLACDTETDQVVALKRILPQIAEDDEFIQMFEDEARIASQLEHPHIARTFDFGRIQDSYYIAFEFVDGRDLRSLFDRCVRLGEKPPLAFLLYVFARIGEGLAYAHARKDVNGEPVSIVHRDVSPQNIMVSFDGDVKLIDFGIAKAAGKLSRTQVGTLKGKFGYMAPEQIRGMEVDHRADLFSMGICMWELLTLERLFSAENELLVLEKVRSLTIAPPSVRNHEVPPELDRVVLKALAKDAGERYRSAKDLFRDLDRLAQTIGATASREEIARYMRGAFPESLARRPTPTDFGAVQTDRPPANVDANGLENEQEMSTMTLDHHGSDKRSSDLDIFEGLGKKSSAAPVASSRPSSMPPPPPPRSMPTNPPMVIKNDVGKKTLVGMSPGVAAPPVGSAPPAAGRIVAPRSAPPPPPGRGSLPQVVPPPPRASAMPPAIVSPAISSAIPSPAVTAPGGLSAPAIVRSSAPPPPSPAMAKAKAGLTMDWDDEDEATHVFDKAPSTEPSDDAAVRAPRPAAGTPLAPPVLAGTPLMPPVAAAAAAANVRATLVGLASPFAGPNAVVPSPPPSSRFSAPPAPSSLNALARGTSAAPPPPPSSFGPPPAAPSFPLPSSGLPPQVNTAPMPMPGRPYSSSPATNGVSHPFVAQPVLPPVSALAAPPMPSRLEATALVRPPASRVGLIATVIGVTAVVTGLAFMVVPRTGRVAINVADAKGAAVTRVEIFVDGKKQCDTAPCTVDQVSSGTHAVKVIAPGYDAPADKSVEVESRKDTSLDFALTSTSSRVGTGIKVSGSQPGVKLYVDAKEIGPLPQELFSLTPGEHKVRLAGSDRYLPLEKTVNVGQDEVQDLGDQTLKVVKGKATIELDTPGAKVSIVSGNDRREFPTLPIAVDLDTSKGWALEASKPGFNDYRQNVSFDDGVAEKSFKIALDPKQAAVTAAAVPAAAPAPGPAPAPAAPRFVAAVTKPAKEAPSSDEQGGAAPSGGEGFLNINSLPASSVTLDGKPIGSTPKVHLTVSAGSHTVVFTNADQGLKKQITVSVGAGETKPAIAKLRD